jgi:RimJ/RimL family protein N-acetyltransferase
MPPLPLVSIRRYLLTDVDELFRAMLESRGEISPWMVWCHPDYSMDDASSWIQTTIAAHEAKTSFDFAIFDESGTFAGACGINRINPIDRFANLGYWVRTSQSGRSIAPAAVLKLAEWTFANTDLNRLEIVAAVGNTKSQRVAEKVGALREGVLRNRLLIGGAPTDAVMYSLVRPNAGAR